MINQEEIYKQCFSDNPAERVEALIQLRDNCSLLPEKERVWGNLSRLISDEIPHIRFSAVEALGTVFQYMPDKKQAWNELIKLTADGDYNVRDRVFSVIGSTFSHIPDKQQAWNDLHELINNEDEFVRAFASKAICCAFSHIPNKKEAWDDLIKLSSDGCADVCYDAANALASAFPKMLDKEQAWNDLIRLSIGEDGYWGLYAYHTLGKVSIFKASQAEKEEDYKKELEKAIEFFEEEIQVLHFGWDPDDPGFDNPSEFCLPFYRSFYTIIFKKQDTKEEVEKYLAEAKNVIWRSRSRELLLKAVENLANALREVQNLKIIDLRAMKGELNFYRKYCENAAELMRETEEEAPYAIAAMRKGLPILDRNLKQILEEIQDKAKIACQVSQGTSTQEIACEINREVQKWEIGSQEEMTQMVENLAYTLEAKISVQPKNQYILGKIGQMKSERNLVKQYEILAQIIPLIRNVTMVPVEPVLEKIESLEGKLDAKFEEMIVSLKPGPRAEIVISMGLKALGSGAQGVITIPLKEIDYPELSMDLEEIKDKSAKLPEVPNKLFNKIRGKLSSMIKSY